MRQISAIAIASIFLLRPGTIRIHPALDLSQPLLVLMNHRDYSNHAANDDRHDRHQQSVQTKNSIHNVIHHFPPRPKQLTADSGGADRDRTGGLLVANQALSQLSYSPITPVVVISCQWSETPSDH